MNKRRYKNAATGAFIGWIGIILCVIFLLITGCHGTYYITDAEYSDLREEHAVNTFHNNQIYWGWHSGYYYYYGKPHYYPWYYYYKTCPPSHYHKTTHVIVKRPVNKPVHRPKLNKIINGSYSNVKYTKPNKNRVTIKRRK